MPATAPTTNKAAEGDPVLAGPVIWGLGFSLWSGVLPANASNLARRKRL